MPQEEDKIKQIAGLGLNISNSGASFRVVDEGRGPCIVVSASTFNNLELEFKVHTTKEALLQLSEVFAAAAQAEYSEKHHHAAVTLGQRVSSFQTTLNKLKNL